MTTIAILGRSGRMGRAIAEAAAERGILLTDAPDVFIDFSAPAALANNLERAVGSGHPIVIGTTGLDEQQHRLIDEAAGEIPVLHAANMSLGVNILAHLVRQTAARLGTDWDIEIVETHHRHKVDAPSGTALLLGQAAARGRGADLARVRSASDRSGARREGEIGFAVLRGGSVAGDHQIVFAGTGERIELGHRAESRAIFAEGAIRAALWLADRPAGRYSMDDVLGLTDDLA